MECCSERMENQVFRDSLPAPKWRYINDTPEKAAWRQGYEEGLGVGRRVEFHHVRNSKLRFRIRWAIRMIFRLR